MSGIEKDFVKVESSRNPTTYEPQGRILMGQALEEGNAVSFWFAAILWANEELRRQGRTSVRPIDFLEEEEARELIEPWLCGLFETNRRRWAE